MNRMTTEQLFQAGVAPTREQFMEAGRRDYLSAVLAAEERREFALDSVWEEMRAGGRLSTQWLRAWAASASDFDMARARLLVSAHERVITTAWGVFHAAEEEAWQVYEDHEQQSVWFRSDQDDEGASE